MTCRKFTIMLALCLTAAAHPLAKPNVLLIVSDDQGYRDLGCFGSGEVRTPHLDRLAAGGIRLTSFYVAWPACTPSRGALLTGRYPQRNGIYDMIRNEAPDYGYQYKPGEYEATFERIGGMDTREVLLPRELKSAGYVSGIFGKWDLGVHRRFLPLARGFDDFYGFVNTGIDYYTHERYGVPSMYRNNSPTTVDKGTYCTDLFEREAVRFLKANRRKPFFLYVPVTIPHANNEAGRKGMEVPDLGEYAKTDWPEIQKSTAAMISRLDRDVGRLMAMLKRLGIDGNTVVFFTSDNGPHREGGNDPEFFDSNGLDPTLDTRAVRGEPDLPAANEDLGHAQYRNLACEPAVVVPVGHRGGNVVGAPSIIDHHHQQVLARVQAFAHVEVEGGEAALVLTHQQIADMVGTSRETVTRSIKQLKESGWLSQEGKRYVIPDDR